MELDRFGSRFTNTYVESDYRRWRNEQNLPAIRLAVISSIPTWLVTPLLGYLWRRDIEWLAFWWWGYVLVVPTLSIVAVVSITRFRRATTALGALALSVVGTTLLWIILVKGSILTGQDPGPAAANMILMASFALFMRLPPLLAMIAIAPFMLSALAFEVRQFLAQALPAIQAYAYVTTQVFAFFFVVVMSIIGERFFRRAYVNDRLLARRSIALEESRTLIRRYVPPALADHIIDGRTDGVEAPQRQRLTMLFADIVGFTEIADRVEPEVLTQIISEYMAAMVGIIERERGTVNEFMGDGLMALFGAPVAMDPQDQTRSALRAAQAMHRQLPALHGNWRKQGVVVPLQIRVGINTGMVSVGSYGSEGRMTYTAIGLQTNIAARIQGHCKPGGILLSEVTRQLLGEDVACMLVGEVACKGVHYPVVVYAPVE